MADEQDKRKPEVQDVLFGKSQQAGQEQGQQRGNTAHDLKPEWGSRGDMKPRGIGGPPTPGGPGGSMSVTHRYPQSERRAQEHRPESESHSRDRSPENERDGQEKSSFRGFGRSDDREKSKDRDNEKDSFRGFGKGDLSRDFNDRSR